MLAWFAIGAVIGWAVGWMTAIVLRQLRGSAEFVDTGKLCALCGKDEPANRMVQALLCRECHYAAGVSA